MFLWGGGDKFGRAAIKAHHVCGLVLPDAPTGSGIGEEIICIGTQMVGTVGNVCW